MEGLKLTTFLVVKQRNKRKLNTHLWFFGGFGKMMNPRYVMLLDVGTGPEENALFELWKAMNVDPNCVGTCGEIAPDRGDFCNLIISAQWVEYKFAHILDKALESSIGYITVLPGAFSAYEWNAINCKPLWEDYFHSLNQPHKLTCFDANVYLAEDRVLCLNIVASQNKQYTLRYVKKSVAYTDVPDTFTKLLAQRRRWINGSWHALVSNLNQMGDLKRTKHNCGTKLMLWFLMSYFVVNVVLAWIMVGSLFLVFAIMTKEVFQHVEDEDWSILPSEIIISLYVVLLI